MRHLVVEKIQTRAASSSAVVLSKPLIIAENQNVYDLKLSSRLKRLGYRRVDSRPTRASQYFRGSKKWQISIRDFQLPTGAIQEQLLAELNLNGSGDIVSIKDIASSSRLDAISLEPEVISQLGNSSRRAVSFKKLDEFPEHLKQAIISIEDERFYSHIGVDPISIGRALFANMTSGKIVQGASTITQQLVKNLFLSSERTISRKVIEALSAILLETAFTKDQILELYLNEVFLAQEGNTAVHGFAEAAKSFFRKNVSELSLAELATLAGLVKAPTSYSPRKNPERSKKRRGIVLSKMREHNHITEEELQKASEVKLSVSKKTKLRKTSSLLYRLLKEKLL